MGSGSVPFWPPAGGSTGLNNKTTTKRTRVNAEGAHFDPSSLNFPLADLGVPIPYLVGTQRVFAPNTIWVGNIRPIVQITREVTRTEDNPGATGNVSVGGSGGGSGGSGTVGLPKTTVIEETVTITRTIVGYNASVQMGVCLGPGAILKKIFVGDKQVWSGTAGPTRTSFTLATSGYLSGNVIFNGGNFDQAKDPFLLPFIDGSVLSAYSGVAYIIIENVNLAETGDPISFEVERHPNVLSLDAGVNKVDGDINLASALADFISTEWGGAGAGLDKIDTDSFEAAAATLHAESNTCSLYIQEETSTTDVIKILADQADGIVFENPDTGLIELKLIRYANLGPGDTTRLSQFNVVRVDSAEWSSWVGTLNKYRVKFLNRDKGYTEDSVIGYNSAAVNEQIKSDRVSVVTYQAVTRAAVAEALVVRDLAIFGQPILGGRVTANRTTGELLPGDGLTIFLPERGIATCVGYVRSVSRHELDLNTVSIEFRQVPRDDNSIGFGTTEESLAEELQIAIDKPTAVRVLQPPFWIARAKGYTIADVWDENGEWTLAMALPTVADDYQLSFDAKITNYPNVTGSVATVIDDGNYPCVAELTSAIGQFDAMDGGIITSVTIENVANGAVLEENAIGLAGLRKAQLLIFIGNEILSCESITDNLDGTYDLNNVHRALMDTSPVGHAASATVHIVSNDFRFVGEAPLVLPLGYTPTWRIVSNTLFSQGDVTDSDHYIQTTSFDVTNNRIKAPIRPHDLKVGGADRSDSLTNDLGEIGIPVLRGDALTLTWKIRSRAVLDIVLQSDDSDLSEVNNDATYVSYNAKLLDAGATIRDCGSTLDDDAYETLAATVHASSAFGTGYLYVQAVNQFGNSLYHDYIPLYVVPSDYFGSEDDLSYFVDETGALQFFEEY